MLDQKLPPPDTFTAYEVIVHEARTRTRRARYVQAGLVAAAAVAVIVTGQLGGSPLDPTPTPAPTPAPVDEPTSPATHASGVDGWDDVAGQWRTAPVSIDDMVEVLTEAGFDGDLENRLGRLLPDELDAPAGVPLTLTIRNGAATLQTAESPIEILHDQWYSVDEPGTVTLRPYAAPGGRSRFAVERRGDVLTWRLLDTTVGAQQGVASEMLLTALYMTVPFEWTEGVF